MNRNNGGFSAVITVIVIIAVMATAGLIVWRVLEANKSSTTPNQKTANQEQTQSQAQTDPNEGYVVIKEWGVRFKPVEGLTDVEYFKPKAAQGDAISIVTAELIARSPDCGKESNTLPLGLLQRTTSTPNPENGGIIREINGYTYQYRASGAACSDGDTNMMLESQTGTLISKSLKTLEPAK